VQALHQIADEIMINGFSIQFQGQAYIFPNIEHRDQIIGLKNKTDPSPAEYS
jgi:hypothetical protein